MADVQLENGFTKIANKIIEALAKMPLNGTQRRIIDVIIRFTYGFNRKEHDFSINFLIKAMSLKNTQYKQICRELRTLIDMKILIEESEPTKNSSRCLSFNKNYDLWLNKTREPLDELDHSEWLNKTREPLDELDQKEINTINKTIKKDLSLEIENFRHKFSDFLELVDEYFDILRTTRVSGVISGSVILKVYQAMDKHPVIVVKAALLTIIHNPALHSKRENYFYGIMRNTDAAEAERRIQKYKAMQTENQKPNEEYQRIKERLRDGNTGI